MYCFVFFFEKEETKIENLHVKPTACTTNFSRNNNSWFLTDFFSLILLQRNVGLLLFMLFNSLRFADICSLRVSQHHFCQVGIWFEQDYCSTLVHIFFSHLFEINVLLMTQFGSSHIACILTVYCFILALPVLINLF